jgi:hypothetical protein
LQPDVQVKQTQFQPYLQLGKNSVATPLATGKKVVSLTTPLATGKK